MVYIQKIFKKGEKTVLLCTLRCLYLKKKKKKKTLDLG